MILQLIHIDNYLIAVDDSEIKEGDWYFDSTDKKGLLPIYQRSQDPKFYSGCKKITHHLPLNGSPTLEGVTLLPPIPTIC